jgi:hypothetical protein
VRSMPLAGAARLAQGYYEAPSRQFLEI